MDDARPPEADPLAVYRRRYSRRGLLGRYARGRVRSFRGRLPFILLGGLVLGLANGAVYGLAVSFVLLLGEAVDCFYLRHVARRLRAGATYTRFLWPSTATAGFQAFTVALSVCAAWYGEGTSGVPLFSFAFLAGVAINAGIVLPFQSRAAVLRLAIYGATALGLSLGDLFAHWPAGADRLLNFAGTLMLAAMVGLSIHSALRAHRRHRRGTHDLTRLNLQLAKHQKEARQLSLVAQHANDSVLVLDATRRIVWVNRAFTEITGYAPEDAIGCQPGDILNGPGTDREVTAALAAAIARGEPFRGEIRNTARDGRQIWIETNQVPVRDETGALDMVVAIERDITASKRHAEELAQARAAAEAGARSKTEFLAMMSHEIRTPMNAVLGMTDLLAQTRLSADQRDCVDTVRSSARALLTIIEDVLDMSRLDARQMRLHPVDFDLCACIDDIVRLLRPQAEAKGLRLLAELDPDLPNQVHADDGRLRQVLVNLVGNAVKFTEAGQVTLHLRAEAQEGGHRLITEVTDTGIGIAADQLERIFDSFSQAETAAGARDFGGTGLGLTISRELVQLMGGGIVVESTPGAGSRFRLTVPVAAPQAAGGAEPGTAGGDPAEVLAGLSVLVADDNEVNRVLIGKFLSGLPLDLHFAGNGRQVLEMVGERMPDLILMDMSMPVMCGLEATRRIRARGGKQPAIIALTANSFDSDRRACRQAGMTDFLSKPVRRADLVARMLRHAPARDSPQGGDSNKLPCAGG